MRSPLASPRRRSLAHAVGLIDPPIGAGRLVSVAPVGTVACAPSER